MGTSAHHLGPRCSNRGRDLEPPTTIGMLFPRNLETISSQWVVLQNQTYSKSPLALKTFTAYKSSVLLRIPFYLQEIKLYSGNMFLYYLSRILMMTYLRPSLVNDKSLFCIQVTSQSHLASHPSSRDLERFPWTAWAIQYSRPESLKQWACRWPETD